MSTILGASSAAALVIVAGVFFGRWIHGLGRWVAALLLGAAGGTVLAVIGGDLLPMTLTRLAPAAVFGTAAAGFLAATALHLWQHRGGLPVHEQHHTEWLPAGAEDRPAGGGHAAGSARGSLVLIAGGVAVHNLLEGLAAGIGFHGEARAGLLLLVAIALHNVPLGVALAVPLERSGARAAGDRGRGATVPPDRWLLITAAALSGPVGAYAGAAFGGAVAAPTVGLGLSAAAGIMLAIVIQELIPEALHRHRVGGLTGAAVGVALVLAVRTVFL